MKNSKSLYTSLIFFFFISGQLFSPGNLIAGNSEAPFIYKVLPAGTHFYCGDNKEGFAFLAGELLLCAEGIAANGRLDRDGQKEWNVPLILAGQLYSIDKWRYFQKQSIKNHNFRVDKSSLPVLLKSPFEPKYIISPLVLTFAFLGAADGIFGYPRHKKHYNNIKSVQAMDYRMNRRDGTIYYETATTALSYGAAVSEEMMFRGILLPVMDSLYGKKTGLFASSLIFGLLHLTNPDIDNPAYYAAQATLAGLILGWDVQKNDYRMGKAIAGHFWYDAASFTSTWIANPRENPIGIKVNFEF